MRPRHRPSRHGASATAPSPAPEPGGRSGAPRIPGLLVGAELGRGAGSVVYRVRKGDSDYALKILEVPPPDVERTMVGFRREATVLATVSDPRIPVVHAVGQCDGRPYLVMDLFDGRSLAEVIDAGPLPPAQAVELMLDLVEPLSLMHGAGLMHRDIKPQNIVVLDVAGARLIDFGLAVRDRSRLAGIAASELAVGTLAYAAPEQAGTLRRPVDHRSDLYSLGVVLFECLTGTPPFRSDDAGELLRLHAVEPAPDLRTLLPIGDGLAALVGRLLAKDPDDRYQSAHELAAHLRLLAADPDAAALPAVTGLPRARREAGLGGRDTELGTLVGYWRRARAGRGASCELTGPAGIGLTRLAAELAVVARADGAPVLELACRPDDAVPFAALRRAIEVWLSQLERLPAAEREAAWNGIRAAAGPVAAQVAALSSRLGDVLGADPVPAPHRQERFAAAVADLLTELAHRFGALLMVVDDAQVMDPGTERAIAELLGHLRETPLLIVGTTCVDRVDHGRRSELRREMRAAVDAEIDLQPLDDVGVAELVGGRLPGVDRESRLSELLSRRCQGNPLVIVEYLRAIVDAGLLSPYWGSWVVDADGITALDLPADALGLVLARIGRLDEEVRELLVVAAVIGDVFAAEVVSEVAGVDPDLTLASLTMAAAENLVEGENAVATGRRGRFRFLHALIRDALLDLLDGDRLAALHHRVGDVLDRHRRGREPEPGEPNPIFAVARHFLRGDPNRWAYREYRVWRDAGLLALREHAPDQAVEFLQRAAEIGPLDADLLHRLGSALALVGRYAEAREQLDAALEVQPEPVGRARVQLLRADIERLCWNTEAAWAAVHAGLAELGRRSPGRGPSAVLGALLRVLVGVPFALARRALAGAAGRAGPGERVALACELHRAAGYLATVGMRPGLALLHAAHDLPELCRLGAGGEYALGSAWLGFIARLLGQDRLADRLQARADAVVREHADPQLQANVEWYRAGSEFLSGRDDGQRLHEVLDGHGRWLGIGQLSDGIATLGRQAATMGRIGEAQSWYERGRQHTRMGRAAESTSLLTLAVGALTAAGRPVEAATELRRIAELDAVGHSRSLQISLMLARMHAMAEQGEAGPALDEMAATFAGFGLRPARLIRQHRIFLVHLALGRLAQLRNSAESDDTRPAALAAARHAVHDVRRAANTDVLAAFAAVTEAELQVLCGQPDRALRILGRIRPYRQDAPVLDFERARTTARALAGAGFDTPARKQALTAMIMAAEAGLTWRARWIGQEFGLSTSSTTGMSSHSESVGSSTGHRMEHQRLEALQDISRAASKVLDPGELARICLDRTLRILSAERAVLFLADEDEAAGPAIGPTPRAPLEPYLGRDREGRDVPMLTGYSASLVERVRLTREPIVITGTEEGAALGAQSVVLHGLRSIMVAPLQLDGRLLGVVYLDSQLARGIFTADDADILTALMTHIATSLETARAAELEVSVRTAQRQRDFAEVVREAFAEMSSTLDPDEVLARLVVAVPKALPGVAAQLIAVDDPLLESDQVRAVMDRRRPVTGGGRPPAALAPLLRSAAAWSLYPLHTADRTLGLMVLSAAGADDLAPAQLDLASALVGQAATAYDRAALFSRVQELAVLDGLTRVANRRRFFEVAERSFVTVRRLGGTMHALMIDIDHFKQVNDSFGHAAGDEVIRAVAERLRRQIGDGDVLGRYGGEEFALVLLENAASGQLAERLRTSVSDVPVPITTGELTVTVSIGLAAVAPIDAGISDVLARADAALYEAKRAGRNRVVVHRG